MKGFFRSKLRLGDDFTNWIYRIFDYDEASSSRQSTDDARDSTIRHKHWLRHLNESWQRMGSLCSYVYEQNWWLWFRSVGFNIILRIRSCRIAESYRLVVALSLCRACTQKCTASTNYPMDMHRSMRQQSFRIDLGAQDCSYKFKNDGHIFIIFCWRWMVSVSHLR